MKNLQWLGIALAMPLATAVANAELSIAEDYLLEEDGAYGTEAPPAEPRELHKSKYGYAPQQAYIPQYAPPPVIVAPPTTHVIHQTQHVVHQPVVHVQEAPRLCVTGGCQPTVMAAPQVVVDRQEVSRIVKERSCPNGMTLEGDQCVGYDVCPASYVCPAGTTMQGGRCVSFCRPLAECPIGYNMSNGRCTACDVSPAEFICQDPSYTLDPTGMSCTRSVETPPYCPPGYSMDSASGSCIQRVAHMLTCPVGYTLSGRDCVRSISSPATIVCPDGATLDSQTNKCIIIKQDAPYCPPRFNFDHSTQSCVQQAPRVPSPCPSGYNRVGSDSCERADRTAAEPYCPTDYSLDYDGQCIKHVPVPPRCPPGHNHSSSRPGMCERIVKQIPVCSNGTTMTSNGRCEMIHEQPSIECCPPGFELSNGRCHRLEQLASEMTCENECYRTTETKVAYACPDDADFMDHPVNPQCIRRIMAQECVATVTLHRRCMAEAKEGRELQGCPAISTLRAQPSVPTCDTLRTETIPAQAYCPEGGELEGRRCVLREPIVPERRCRIGRLDVSTGQCVRESFVPIKRDCPAGTTRRNNRCVTIEQNPPSFICPAGTEESNGVCLTLQASIESAPVVSRVAPQFSCPSGSSLSGRDCVSVSRIPMETVCPAGTTEAGTGSCQRTASMIVPPPVEKCVRASHICPNSGALVGTQCSITERVPADAVCPGDAVDTSGYNSGYGNSNNPNCQRTVAAIQAPPRVMCQPARPTCPPGMQLRGTSCTSTRIAELSYSCAAGYVLENGQCVRELERQAICPAGTQLSHEGCVRRISVAPTVRIVQGCTHDVVLACPTCPRNVASTCNRAAF